MDTQPIKTLNELIYQHEHNHPGSYFFSRKTLKFFGERISSMRLLKNKTKVTSPSGDEHICYVVSSVQSKAPSGPKKVYHYFDVNTLEHVIKD